MSDQTQSLPPTGYLRILQIIGSRKKNPPIPALIPVGRTTWLDGVKSGRYPQPVKGLGKRITVWRVEDILAFIDEISSEHQNLATPEQTNTEITKQQKFSKCEPAVDVKKSKENSDSCSHSDNCRLCLGLQTKEGV